MRHGEEEPDVGGQTLATNGDLRKDGRKKGEQHHKQFAADTAERTGQSVGSWRLNVSQRHNYRCRNRCYGNSIVAILTTPARSI